jgi:hypothetical protein
MQDGAKPFPGAPKRPGAVPTPMTRPFQKGADGCFYVPGDEIHKYNHANYDNNNQDSMKAPTPSPRGPQTTYVQPEGKPYA